MQNVRRGRYELAVEAPIGLRVRSRSADGRAV